MVDIDEPIVPYFICCSLTPRKIQELVSVGSMRSERCQESVIKEPAGTRGARVYGKGVAVKCDLLVPAAQLVSQTWMSGNNRMPIFLFFFYFFFLILFSQTSVHPKSLQ